ncbi:MAG: hypothetical protein ABS894_00850 [Aerococcus urinaeequi]
MIVHLKVQEGLIQPGFYEAQNFEFPASEGSEYYELVGIGIVQKKNCEVVTLDYLQHMNLNLMELETSKQFLNNRVKELSSISHDRYHIIKGMTSDIETFLMFVGLYSKPKNEAELGAMLYNPVPVPAEVYDAMKKIQESYQGETGYALISTYEYFGLESLDANEVAPLIPEIKKVALWRDSNIQTFKLMSILGYSRQETTKEKWVRNMMELINDPEIKQKQFLEGIYEQYQVAEILEKLGEKSVDCDYEVVDDA